MESYKKCPFKKRPIFYETIIEMDQPQDLSLKRKTSSSKICPIEEKRNFFLNLSTNSYYDQMRQNTNDILNRSESPKSITSESSFQDLSISTTTTIINNEPENYENIHLRGLLKSSSSSLNNNNYINNYLPKTQQYCWPTTTSNYQIQLTPQHQQQYSDFSYNLTPPSSPLSSSLSEPEDLSMKNTILSLPKISYQQFHHHHHRQHHNPEEDIQSIAAPKQNRPSKLLSSTKPKELNRFKCEKCFKSYSTNTGLSKHQHFHCPSAECNQIKKDFSCQNCDKVYTTLGALKMHIRTHTLPCKCPICGKAFSRPWLLQGHIRTHTGEKPFTCQHCNRAFADRSNLRAHQQTHVDIKKYICENCQKSFSRMSLLTKHIAGGCSGAFV